MSTTEEIAIKIVAVGDKSSLKNEFLWTYTNRNYNPNITKEFDYEALKIPNKNIRIDLWNAQGKKIILFKILASDRVRSLIYPKTDVFLLFYNTMNRSSYENVKKIYLPELKQNASKVPIILIATNSEEREKEESKKKDVNEKKKEIPVSIKEGMYLKVENSEIIHYKEPDFKTKLEVDEIFYLAVENYLSTHSKKNKGFFESLLGK